MQREIPTMTPEYVKLMVAFKQFFDTESGGKILEDLKSYCMHDASPVQKRTNQSIDPYEVMFLEGRRDVIDYILRNINKDLPKG